MRTLLVSVILCGLAVFMLSLADVNAQEVREDTKTGFVDPSLLEVVMAEFAADPYSRANYEPFIKMRVFNNSPETITRAYLDVEFTADNGNHKLYRERFIQIVNGGMRPYSSAVWLFYPRGSSAMALKGLPQDTQMAVTVHKLFCPKKNSPWQYEHKFDLPTRHDMAW